MIHRDFRRPAGVVDAIELIARAIRSGPRPGIDGIKSSFGDVGAIPGIGRFGGGSRGKSIGDVSGISEVD